MLRILLLLNANHKLQDRKLDTLIDSSQEIVEVVSINLDALHSDISDRIARESSRQARDRLDAERRHRENKQPFLPLEITNPGQSQARSTQLLSPNI